MDCNKRPNTEDLQPILFKLDKKDSNFSDIYIDKTEFKIGRGLCNDQVITDILISRNHAVIKCDENDNWTILHLSSNVTLLNNESLEVGVPRQLRHGDFVQFSLSSKFIYIFKLCPKSLRDSKRQRLNQCMLDTIWMTQKSFAQAQETKRKELEEKLKMKQNKQIELKGRLDQLLKNQELANDKTEDLNKKILDLQDKIKIGNNAEMHLQHSYNELMSKLEKERLEFEERLNDERQKWQMALDTSKQEKEELEKNMRERMEKLREEQQAEWTRVMETLVKQEKTAQERLLDEKTQLEQKLKETESALKEQAAINEQLQSTANNVGAMDITSTEVNPECIYVHLLDDSTTGRVEILETIDLTVDSPCSSSYKDNTVLTKVGSIMDEQLTCSICSELFVKAATLNCTHSFCNHCIISWMKKRRECPVCRATIRAINKSIVLDNFIEQMVENLTPELQTRRRELLEERKAMEKPFVTIKVPKRKT